MVKSYLDLEIYQLAHSLAVEVHKMTVKELPKFEMYEEAGQLRRSSKSVSATIVEGYGRRRYKAEFMKFLVYSHASCDESIEHLKYLKDTESLAAARADYFLASYDKLGRKITSSLRALSVNIDPKIDRPCGVPQRQIPHLASRIWHRFYAPPSVYL